jgi:hypothetical protein
MNAEQAAAWERGGAAAAEVESQIAQTILTADCVEDVVVTTDEGALAYRLCWGPLVGADD